MGSRRGKVGGPKGFIGSHRGLGYILAVVVHFHISR